MAAEVRQRIRLNLPNRSRVTVDLVGVFVSAQCVADERVERRFDRRSRLRVELGGDHQHPVALVHLERPLGHKLLVSRFDAVGIEVRLSAGQQLAEFVGAQPRSQPHELPLCFVEPGRVDAHGQPVEQADDRGRRRHADPAARHRLGDMRVLRGQRLTRERHPRRGRLTDLHDAHRLTDARAGGRRDQHRRRCETLLLRERILAELSARLPRDLGRYGGERGIDMTLQRTERLVHSHELSRRQSAGRTVAARGRQRV